MKLPYRVNVILGFIIIGLALYSLYILLSSGITIFNSLSEGSRVTLALGFLSLVSALGTIHYTKIREKRLQIDAASYAKKQKIYSKFTKDLFDIMMDPEIATDDQRTMQTRKAFMRDSILWAHPNVLNAFHAFRRHAQNTSDTGEEVGNIWYFTNLMMEFRKDIGLTNKNLTHDVIVEILFDEKDMGSYREWQRQNLKK